MASPDFDWYLLHKAGLARLLAHGSCRIAASALAVLVVLA
jgi:hypothetical protein